MEPAYQETIKFLFNSLPMYQREGKAAYKANLNNTIQLDKALGQPHKKFKSIHIAGTNGKGSVSHMLASVFQEAGYKTGLYTSPHLLDFRERIRINGSMMPKDKVISFVQRIKKDIEFLRPSFFEMTVAMAFDHFAKENIDIAIIETGLGGRLDSTNIITPELSIITNISLDHTQFLGNTIHQIASEKAGIIKIERPLLIGENKSEVRSQIKEIAQEKKAPCTDAAEERAFNFQTISTNTTSIFHFKNNRTGKSESWECDLQGSYQSENIQTAIAAIDIFKNNGWALSEENVMTGLKNVSQNTNLRGRWEILGANPRIICDTAHNEAGVKMVSQQLQHLAYKSLHIVWGMVNDKSIDKIIPLLPKNAIFYFSAPDINRKMPAKQLFSYATETGLNAKTYPSIREAIDAAKHEASAEDAIFIGGSTFVIAEALPLFE